MGRAVCLIRDQPCYRKDAFVVGLKAAGYQVVQDCNAGPGDVLVIWNKYAQYEATAMLWEARGGTVLVAENGYWGKDEDGIQYYALARHGHNGSGDFPHKNSLYLRDIPTDRWEALHTELSRWRAEGEHILVCGQRGIGSTLMASPPSWAEQTAAQLMRLTNRKIVIRQHPGASKSGVPLVDDLRGAWCCVIWSSGCGVEALIRGIPVIYQAPYWICSDGASSGLTDINNPMCSGMGRKYALYKMSHAQYSVAEIASGMPFELLKPH